MEIQMPLTPVSMASEDIHGPMSPLSLASTGTTVNSRSPSPSSSPSPAPEPSTNHGEGQSPNNNKHGRRPSNGVEPWIARLGPILAVPELEADIQNNIPRVPSPNPDLSGAANAQGEDFAAAPGANTTGSSTLSNTSTSTSTTAGPSSTDATIDTHLASVLATENYHRRQREHERRTRETASANGPGTTSGGNCPRARPGAGHIDRRQVMEMGLGLHRIRRSMVRRRIRSERRMRGLALR